MRIGGRPRSIEIEDIARVGREIGMRNLSLSAVASRLGVSTTALYRHVDGRWGLERLVGESLLAEFRLASDPRADAHHHLLSFGMGLRREVGAHPGLAAYLLTLFPRGESGRALLRQQVLDLGRRGYAPDVALVLASSVASFSIAFVAAEELQREGEAEGDIDRARARAAAQLLSDDALGRAHRELPVVDGDRYIRLVLVAHIRGLLAAAPPGRSLAAVIADLDTVTPSAMAATHVGTASE